MSSVELARRLGTRQPTAWLLKHKLMVAMAAREAEKPRLQGRVEVDDAYLAGSARAASGAAVPPARRRSWPRSRRPPSASPGGSSSRRQGLQQEGDRGAGQARPRRRQQRGHRWPVLLGRGRAGRLHACCDGDPLGAAGSRVGAVHPAPSVTALAARSEPQGRLGQHRARQHQDRARQHLPPRQPEARPALSRQLRLALQPPLPARYPDRAPRLCLRPDRTASLPVIIAGCLFLFFLFLSLLREVQAGSSPASIRRLPHNAITQFRP